MMSLMIMMIVFVLLVDDAADVGNGGGNEGNDIDHSTDVLLSISDNFYATGMIMIMMKYDHMTMLTISSLTSWFDRFFHFSPHVLGFDMAFALPM